MSRPAERIGVEEFRDRLVALGLDGRAGLPRRSRDRHILLASATLWMDEGAVYTEPEINAGLSQWLKTACPELDLDVVTLRRELVDDLYLDRDDSGRHYSAGRRPGGAEIQRRPRRSRPGPGDRRGPL